MSVLSDDFIKRWVAELRDESKYRQTYGALGGDPALLEPGWRRSCCALGVVVWMKYGDKTKCADLRNGTVLDELTAAGATAPQAMSILKIVTNWNDGQRDTFKRIANRLERGELWARLEKLGH